MRGFTGLLGAAAAATAFAAAAVALDRAFPPDLSRLRATGVEVLDRGGRTLSVLPTPGGVWRLQTRVEDVPPHLVALLVAAEDRRFRFHPGVDPLALARAAWQWARHGRVVSGGSTLTMQAARLLEPRPRTFRSKAAEIARALQLEARFSKDEILGIWLTLAPQGGNVEGLRAGSLAWFGRPAARLDPAEAALLVAIPRRPEALRPDRQPERALAARNALLLRRAAGAVGVDDAALALGAPLGALLGRRCRARACRCRASRRTSRANWRGATDRRASPARSTPPCSARWKRSAPPRCATCRTALRWRWWRRTSARARCGRCTAARSGRKGAAAPWT